MSSLRLTRLDTLVWGICALLIGAIFITTVVSRAETAGLRVAFLRNSPGGIANIWVADLGHPEAAKQMTFAEDGIYDFSVSPDGRTIAYSEQDFGGVKEIKQLDLRTGQITALTNCATQDSDCFTPIWRPDGSMIAYQRILLNSSLGIGASPNRIWLLDLTTTPASTYPLVEDTQVLGYDAEWSNDGQRLAFYDNSSGGILVFNFVSDADGQNSFSHIPTSYGTVGTFSPDGSKLVYPEMLFGGPVVHSYLQIADLSTGLFQQLTSPDEEADDPVGVWSPDGGSIAIGRRYLDERYTRGHQIYLIDATTNELSRLVYDENYNHGFFNWSPDGGQLVMQRFRFPTDNQDAGSTQIWTVEVATGALTLIADDAYMPRWIPAMSNE